MSETISDPRRAIRRLNLVGFALFIVVGGGFAGWAATAELSGAVVAPGQIVVEGNDKKVQHPTGGVVSEILVREGDVVEAGQVVMRLDDTVTRATLGVVRSQIDELIARQARLLAERDGAGTIEHVEELSSRRSEKTVATAIQGELRLFESRRGARAGQRSQLHERVGQSRQEIVGLMGQQEAKEQEIAIISEELVGVTALWAKNLVQISRLTTLQRDQARLKGERGQLIAAIARARGKISETELQILQIDQDFQSEVLKDLRESQGKIAELRERVTVAQDQLKRIDIIAPQAGIVHQLAVHTVGGVIANGEAVMMIVPQQDALVVEARVAPQDIDQVVVGATTTVRIMAGNQRTMQDILGTLIRVSADLTREPATNGQGGQSYYQVRVSLPENVLQLAGMRLVPGMPAEAFIQTYARTPLQYLIKPLRDQIDRTFRER